MAWSVASTFSEVYSSLSLIGVLFGSYKEHLISLDTNSKLNGKQLPLGTVWPVASTALLLWTAGASLAEPRPELSCCKETILLWNLKTTWSQKVTGNMVPQDIIRKWEEGLCPYEHLPLQSPFLQAEACRLTAETACFLSSQLFSFPLFPHPCLDTTQTPKMLVLTVTLRRHLTPVAGRLPPISRLLASGADSVTIHFSCSGTFCAAVEISC